MGMAISCKLFAFALFPTFALLLFKKFKGVKSLINMLLITCFVAFISFLVFYVSNPLLYDNFFHGIKMMSVVHVGDFSGDPFLFNFRNFRIVRCIITYPLVIVRPRMLDSFFAIGIVPLAVSDVFLAILGYGIVIISLLMCDTKRNYLLFVWFSSSYLFTSFVIISLPSEWLHIRTLILPAISTLWLVSSALGMNMNIRRYKRRLFGFR